MTDPFSPPSTEPVLLEVSGMTCSACTGRVRKALLEVPGVLDAEVNLSSRTARVIRNAGQASDALLTGAVARAGYAASVPPGAREFLARRDEAERQETSGWGMRAATGTLAAGVLLMMHAHGSASPWPPVVLAGLAQIALGMPFYRQSWKALRGGYGSMDLLVALGSTAGFSLALAAAFSHKDAGIHFDCAPAVLAAVSLGKWLEARARRSAGGDVRALAGLLPDKAIVLREGRELEIPLAELRLGDRVRVPANASIPVDGLIEEGSTRIDEATMTGEALPAEKAAGDHVTAGTMNGEGPLVVKAERVGEETVLARILRRVETAQATRASSARLADRIAGVLVPVALLASAGALAFWGLGRHDWTTGWTAAVSVLLVTCPCALGLAIPAALSVGTGMAARRGVLFRDAAALERAAGIRSVWLDKTGTLTKGQAQVVWFWHPEGENPNTVMRLSASAAKHDPHPAARAVVKQGIGYGINIDVPRKVEAVPGGGINATLADGEVLVGSEAFLASRGVDLSPLAPMLLKAEGEGFAVVCSALNGRAMGVFAMEDVPRPEAGQAVRRLQELGLTVGVLSGDRISRTRTLAQTVGISEVRGELSPAAKAEALRDAAVRFGGPVAMVGDGVNDAAALAEAPLGIAMGSGAVMAREAASVTLVGEDLCDIAWTISLARAVRRTVLQNLVWALAYNLVALPLAALGRLAPWQAAALMALSSLAVVANALLLRRREAGTA